MKSTSQIYITSEVTNSNKKMVLTEIKNIDTKYFVAQKATQYIRMFVDIHYRFMIKVKFWGMKG